MQLKNGQPGVKGCLGLFKWGKKGQHHIQRVVSHPEIKDDAQRTYCGNTTTTTKYNLLTFIPKSLFEQYR
jgi:hypothetical protein